MNLNIKNKKVAIIGAGISGLILADKLSKISDVRVFDKSRGIGGRMATRRVDNYHFDHGAQFFTAQCEIFQNFCQKAENDNIIERWMPKYAEISGDNVIFKDRFTSGKPYFVAKPQMNSLCKYLAKDINIELNKKIEFVDYMNNKWLLKTENEEFGDFDYLILAIPSHQAAELAPKSFKYFDLISKAKMLGCFSLMIGLEKELKLDFDAALVKDSIINWISLNNSKPGRPNATSLLVNSSNDWAESCIEDDLDSLKQQMLDQLSKIIDLDSDNINYSTLHRWRYANCVPRNGEKSLFDPDLKLGVCGDWLTSGKVENAFLSGIDLFQKIS